MIKPLFQKIIVAVNGSSSSIHAAMYGILLARQYNAKIKAVFVVDTTTIQSLTLFRLLQQEENSLIQNKLTQDGKNYLSHIASLGRKKGVIVQTELKTGSVWAGIVEATQEYQGDLILIGGRENTTTLGTYTNYDSVSTSNSQIIAAATCPVLVVKKPDIEQIFKMA